MKLFVIVLGYVIVLLCLTLTTNALQCLECQDMPSPDSCRVVTTCSSNNKCYVEQVVTSGGSVLYNMGCTSASRCSSKRSLARNSVSKRQDTVSNKDIVTCIDCCDGEFCNIEGCGQKAIRQPQRPPLCFTCPNQLDTDSCRDVTMCDPEHMCALHQTVTVRVEWRSECVPALQCQTLEKLSLDNNGACYTCCQEDFCNNNCNQHVRSTSTSLAPASATTKISGGSELTSTGYPIVTMVTPTKRTTNNAISTTIETMASATTNTIGISNTYTLSALVSSSTSATFVSVPDTATMTTVSSTFKADTNKPMHSTYFSNVTTYYPQSTEYRNITNIFTTKSQISSSRTEDTSTESLTSTQYYTPNATTSSYDGTTTQTTTTPTVRSPITTSRGTTQPTGDTTLPFNTTVSIQPSVTLTNSFTLAPQTSTSFNSTSVLSTSASMPNLVTLPTDCNNRTFDICFVIDSSGSLGNDGFQKELQFVSQMVHTIGSDTSADAHFCVITFSTKAHVFINLRHISTLNETIKAIGEIPYRSGESYIHLGLHQAYHHFHTFGRPEAEKEVILITDGTSTNPTKTHHTANVLISYGSDIYAVGIGAQTNKSELPYIVSDKDHLFEVPDIDHLHGAYINILQDLCN